MKFSLPLAATAVSVQVTLTFAQNPTFHESPIFGRGLQDVAGSVDLMATAEDAHMMTGKAGKGMDMMPPSTFLFTDMQDLGYFTYRRFLFSPDPNPDLSGFPVGEIFDLPVVADDLTTVIGSQRGTSNFLPPFTEGNYVANRVFTVNGETLTIAGTNDIVAASEGYKMYIGGKIEQTTIQYPPPDTPFGPGFVFEATLVPPGGHSSKSGKAAKSMKPTPSPTPTPKAFDSLQELSAAVRAYMDQGCPSSQETCEVGLTYGYPMNTWDVSMVTSFFQLFLGMETFNEDISDWNTSSVTNMLNTFQACTAFNGDLSKWDVSANRDFRSTFSSCASFNSDISGWNTSSAMFFSAMFIAAEKFDQDLNGWDMSGVRDAAHMFDHASKFNGDITSWDTSNIGAVRAMFLHAKKFNQDISGWNLSSTKDAGHMFEGADKFNQDLCAWDATFQYGQPFFNIFDDSGCEYTGEPDEGMHGPFCHACESSRRVLRKNTVMEDTKPTLSQKFAASGEEPRRLHGHCFANKTELSEGIAEYFEQDCPNNSGCAVGAEHGWPMNAWCTGSVTDMESLFEGMKDFDEDISDWDVSAVSTMRRMFYDARAFNGDLSGWNTSSNTNMWESFYNAWSFEGGDLTGWDVSSVTHFYHTFWYARSFNGDISNWQLDSIGNGRPSVGLNGFLFGAVEFNGDLSGWDVTNAAQLLFAFWHNYKFNSDLSGWNVSRSNYNRGMFYNAKSFNQDVSGWRTTSAFDNLYMFQGSALNQDLCPWGEDPDYVYKSSVSMFEDTHCAKESDPEADEAGPFCAKCN